MHFVDPLSFRRWTTFVSFCFGRSCIRQESKYFIIEFRPRTYLLQAEWATRVTATHYIRYAVISMATRLTSSFSFARDTRRVHRGMKKYARERCGNRASSPMTQRQRQRINGKRSRDHSFIYSMFEAFAYLNYRAASLTCNQKHATEPLLSGTLE